MAVLLINCKPFLLIILELTILLVFINLSIFSNKDFACVFKGFSGNFYRKLECMITIYHHIKVVKGVIFKKPFNTICMISLQKKKTTTT